MNEKKKLIYLEIRAGVLSGMRSMVVPAFLAHRILPKKYANFLSVISFGEFIADKTPFIANRTTALPLIGRIAIAGLSGAYIAKQKRSSMLGGAVVSSISALTSTLLSYQLRNKAGQSTNLPGPVLGLVEDGVVLIMGLKLKKLLDLN